MFKEFFKKESPLLGILGLGGGIGRGGGVVQGIEASGGSAFEIGDYKLHVISSSTPSPTKEFTISALTSNPTNNVIDFLVVGGGGGAGGGDNSYGGGGGAGGVIFRPGKPISSTGGPYPITIGSGGSGLPINGPNPGQQPSTDGADTVVGSSPDPIYFIAKGGGGGASGAGYVFGTGGRPGGSGGGGGGGASADGTVGNATQPSQPGESGTYGHSGNGGTSGGGGGGGSGNGGSGPGSGGSGADGYQVPSGFLPPSVPGPLASAISPITAPSPEFRYFGAGGAGNSSATGGAGGGGDGGPSDPLSSLPDLPSAAYGVDGRGSGGASWTSNNPRSYAGDGGNGIVLIKYKFQNY